MNASVVIKDGKPVTVSNSTPKLPKNKIIQHWNAPHPAPPVEDNLNMSLVDAARQALEAMEFFKAMTVQIDRHYANKAIDDLAAALEREA